MRGGALRWPVGRGKWPLVCDGSNDVLVRRLFRDGCAMAGFMVAEADGPRLWCCDAVNGQFRGGAVVCGL